MSLWVFFICKMGAVTPTKCLARLAESFERLDLNVWRKSKVVVVFLWEEASVPQNDIVVLKHFIGIHWCFLEIIFERQS